MDLAPVGSGEMREFMKEMRGSLNEMRGSLKDLTSKTEQLSSQVANIGGKTEQLAAQVANIGDVGYLTELLVRGQVETLHGVNFAGPAAELPPVLSVHDLFELARVALPEETDEHGAPIQQFGLVIVTNVTRAEKLGAAVVAGMSKLRANAATLLEEKKRQANAIEGILAGSITPKMTGKQRASKQAASRATDMEPSTYDEHRAKKNALKAEIAHLESFLRDIETYGGLDAKAIAAEAFGLQAFSAFARTDGIPVMPLEFDIRGSVEWNPPHVTIKVGEITRVGGTAHSDALLKVLQCLAVLYAAVRVILDDDGSAKYNYRLVGLAFFVNRTSQGVFKSEDVDRVIRQNNLRLPPAGNNLNPRETLSVTKVII